MLIITSLDAGITYNADRAIFLGINPMDTTYLIGIMGISNTIGLIVMGKIVDMFRSKIFLLAAIVMLAHSVLIATSDFFPTFTGQGIYFSMFGLTMSSYLVTSTVLIQ